MSIIFSIVNWSFTKFVKIILQGTDELLWPSFCDRSVSALCHLLCVNFFFELHLFLKLLAQI